jgi:hypothetical protein
VILVVVWFVAVPLVDNVRLRRGGEEGIYAHDGLIQTEAAIDLLGTGKNPYTASYHDTPMVDWPFREGDLRVNPALEHLAYLPASFVLPWPFYWAVDALLGWYDHRIFQLVAFLVLWLTARRLMLPTRWYGFTLILALSPLLSPYFLEGRNDIMVLMWLGLYTLALEKHRPVLGMAFLAVACATKPTAWFFVPVAGVLLWSRPELRGSLAGQVGVFGLVFALLILPFVAWAPGPFFEDTILYPSGYGPDPYPLKGMGLSQMMLQAGWLPSNLASFPFGLLQAPVAIGVLLWVVRDVGQNPSLERLWIGYGLLVLTVAFVGRVFNDNHLGFGGLAIVLGYMLREPGS